MELLGCSIEFLKKHLERKFTKKMTFENYGNYWHIDHKIPCCKFDLSDIEQQKQCFNYRNLQPMEARKNKSKNGNLFEKNAQLNLVI